MEKIFQFFFNQRSVTSEREKQIQYANTYIRNLRGKKKAMKKLVARRE